LTNGDLDSHSQASGTATGAVVDLGGDHAASFVVVRGCSGQCRLAVSSDLTDWSEAGNLSGAYATAPITLNRSERYVRILGTPNVAGLRQISVW
jgi:hypothetical protein